MAAIQHFTHGQFECTLFAENERTVPTDRMLVFGSHVAGSGRGTITAADGLWH